MKKVPRKTGCYISMAEEYSEGITPNEAVILSFLPMKWKYITRDENRQLCLWTRKPIKRKGNGWWMEYGPKNDCCTFPYTNLFKMVKWSDNEPTTIDKLITKF